MAKWIHYSPYEKQVFLVCVTEYANTIEDKKTDRRTTNEKENAWKALTNKYADANVTKRTGKQLEACWKYLWGGGHENLEFPGEVIFVGLIPRVSPPHPPLGKNIDRCIRVTHFKPATSAE